jgi:hypothetical protein
MMDYKTKRKTDAQNNVDFVYICIKKEFFDVNMIYLNYYNLKKKKQIEIIYKSPSIFLEGLFLKTPEITLHNIHVTKYDKSSKYLNKLENVELKLYFNESDPQHLFFINILSTLDKYILQYLDKYKQEIETELSINYKDTRPLTSFKFINVIKPVELLQCDTTNIITTPQVTDKKIIGKQWEVTMKSYLDKKIIYDFIKKRERYNKDPVEHHQIMDTKHIFTFNISNIYFSTNTLIPLVKTNRLETNL